MTRQSPRSTVTAPPCPYPTLSRGGRSRLRPAGQVEAAGDRRPQRSGHRLRAAGGIDDAAALRLARGDIMEGMAQGFMEGRAHALVTVLGGGTGRGRTAFRALQTLFDRQVEDQRQVDRKSTRLNSSH